PVPDQGLEQPVHARGDVRLHVFTDPTATKRAKVLVHALSDERSSDDALQPGDEVQGAVGSRWERLGLPGQVEDLADVVWPEQLGAHGGLAPQMREAELVA